jgi:hypothetical protein
MSEAARTGACLCGAVRLTARDLVPEVGACHCKRCQRWSGSALVVVSVPEGGLAVEGREAVAVFATAKAERAFCGRCGSALWFRYRDRPDAPYDVCVGVLDDADGLPLTHEIYVDAKPDGYAFAGEHRRETGAEREARRAREEATE